jgi:DNA-binding response OmpR family regulator
VLRLLQRRLLLSQRMRRGLLLQERLLQRDLLLRIPSDMNGRRPVVLVVDDESSIRTTMCAVLTLKDFFPMPADSVKAALKILGTEHIDAMVLDVRLPDETGLYRSGLDLLQFVRATPEYVQMPVLVLSGQPLSSGEDQLVIAQGAHLFYKPQPYSDLFDYLRDLLEHPPQ